MAAPDIFYFPPQRRPWIDSLFSVFGRALALATRVESGVYAVAGLINLRLQPGVMGSEESLRRFTNQLRKGPLAKTICELSEKDRRGFLQMFNVLNAARLARNELVHEATLGFEHWSEDDDEANRQIVELRLAVRRLAIADRLISALATLLSGGPRPTPAAFRSYHRNLERWVFSAWDQ